MKLVDSHAHLQFPQFDVDRCAVIRSAWEQDVVAIVNVGTDLASSRGAVDLGGAHISVYATVGVHPHDAKSINTGVLEELKALARHPKVVAIGEIGLDYYRDLSPRPVQRRAFADQLALAQDLGLPIVVHSREALGDVLDGLRDWSGEGVLHSYSGGPQRLDQVLGLGFYISIAGPVTFPKADELREVASRIPLNRLLVETDCPYLTPVPYRGRRNEPAHVRYVVEAIARTREEHGEDVARSTADNARRLFGLA